MVVPMVDEENILAIELHALSAGNLQGFHNCLNTLHVTLRNNQRIRPVLFWFQLVSSFAAVEPIVQILDIMYFPQDISIPHLALYLDSVRNKLEAQYRGQKNDLYMVW